MSEDVRHNPPAYLAPYLAAARKHGSGFRSLLWASPQTQAVRFRAVAQSVDMMGKRILDVGCGRGDLYSFLTDHGIVPHEYIGIEGVPDLARAARAQTGATIIEADFIAEPARMFVGSDVICIVGSLNTVTDDAAFEETLRHALQAASEAVVVNFLCDATRAGAAHLRFRSTDEVADMLSRHGAQRVDVNAGYLSGDATVVGHVSRD
jgi:SAM-dependent methyltransferase